MTSAKTNKGNKQFPPFGRVGVGLALRECGMMRKNPIYLVATIVLPILVMLFFTTMMDEGQPQEMPVGVVDLDNTSTTRNLMRRLDMMQTSHITAHYPTLSDARRAIQHNEIYAFIYIPEGTTAKLLASRQPKISFYYSSTSLTAGSLLYRDLKTVATLGNAGVGQSVMRAKGLTDRQTMALLQPVTIDLHPLNNAEINYNLYLSTMLIPACLMLFITLLTTYTLGQELKQRRGRELMTLARQNPIVAVTGKLLPQTLLFLAITFAYLFYIYGILGFSHQGGIGWMAVYALLLVFSAQGFGTFFFGAAPSMRMSMSICSLWGVLSFSMVGAAFPAFAMDPPLEALAWLFPMRHLWIVYAENIFNGYPFTDTWPHIAILIIFATMPLLVMRRIRTVMNTYEYVE